ncbi:MAG TPA: Maf family protein [Phycisphaerales bacterium]|nr:Maf family protein [Phycisphaerales bacterium]
MARVMLASSSPRRRLLLQEAGVPFDWADPGVDDGLLARGEVTPAQWVASLAFLKASAGIERLPVGGPNARWIVLGADTLVVKDGELIGQARSADAARRTIERLRNGSHEVLTGVALIDMHSGERRLFVDAASVRVGELTDDQVAAYVATGGWRGKAGAYNLSERLADGWPIEYSGDPATIVGLPMRRLIPVLGGLGVEIGAAV